MSGPQLCNQMCNPNLRRPSLRRLNPVALKHIEMDPCPPVGHGILSRRSAEKTLSLKWHQRAQLLHRPSICLWLMKLTVCAILTHSCIELAEHAELGEKADAILLFIHLGNVNLFYLVIESVLNDARKSPYL